MQLRGAKSSTPRLYFSLIVLSILARLELHFLSIWLPLGSILAPFWSSLASIWPPWRRLGRVSRNVHELFGFWSPFWLHFGTILAPFWVPGGGPARLGVPRVYPESFLSVFCDFAARPNLGPDAFTSIKTLGS